MLACRVSASGEHVWSLVVENNGQVQKMTQDNTHCSKFDQVHHSKCDTPPRTTRFRAASSGRHLSNAVLFGASALLAVEYLSFGNRSRGGVILRHLVSFAVHM